MKVYIATAGTYSNYHIEAVFTDKEQANACKNLHSDWEIETYNSDTIKIDSSVKARVFYYYRSNTIDEMYTGDEYSYCADSYADYRINAFTLCVTLSGELLEDVKKNGKESKLLLKVVQDRFAQYKDSHMFDENTEEESELVELPREQQIQYMSTMSALVNARITAKQEAQNDKEENT